MKILLVGDYGVIHTRRYMDLALKAGCDVTLLDTGRRDAAVGRISTGQYYSWPRSGRRIAAHFVGRPLANKLADTFDSSAVASAVGQYTSRYCSRSVD